MFHYKRIVISLFVLLAFGLLAQAQSTPRFPYEGALHTYTCNGISPGAAYSFFITANADGSGMIDGSLTGEFEIFGATGVIGADGLASTQIQWNMGTYPNVYHLWLEATIGGCSNNIRLEIAPQLNGFDILSENIPEENTTSCPAIAATDNFNPLASAYSAGETTLRFSVRRVNGSGDAHNWSFTPSLSVNPDLSLLNAIISVESAGEGILSPVAGLYTVNGTDNEVVVTVTVENAPGYIRQVMLQVVPEPEQGTGIPDSNPLNNDVTHTIEVMPLINSMGGV
jgi:hypothetical protein